MKKRVVSLLLCLIMALSLIPTVAFATEGDATPATDANEMITNGEYTANGWNHGGTGSVTAEDGLTLSKTASYLSENTYQIDLSVKTTQKVTTQDSPAAVALVIDTSGSMAWCSDYHKHDKTECYKDSTTVCTAITNPSHWVGIFHRADTSCRFIYRDMLHFGLYPASCGTEQHTHDYATGGYWCDNSKLNKDTDSRIANAKAAATAFISSFISTSADRYVAVIGFNNDVTSTVWYNVSDENDRMQALAAINSLDANGGTDMAKGLSSANTLMSATLNGVEAANKHVILLSDGAPTYANGYGSGSSGSADINTMTSDAAVALKTAITPGKLHTICFSAADEICYSTFDSNGPTVGEFLRNSIASSANDAHTAENATDLNDTFASLSSSITTGLTGDGWTVTDPMAANISVTGSLPTGFVQTDATKNIYTWTLSNPAVSGEGDTKTYTYTTSYTVKIDPNGREANGDPLSENKFYPTNGVTTLNYKNANNESATAYFPVPGVKVKLPDPTPSTNVTANIYIDKRIDVSTGSRQPDPTTFTFKAYYVGKDGKEMTIPKGEFSIRYNGTGTSITGNWTLNIPKDIFGSNNEGIKVFIKEVNSNVPGWTYSNAVYTLHIDSDGKVSVPSVNNERIPHNQDNRLMFTNTYTYTPPARPSDPIRRQPTTTTTTKPVQSVKTGDMGIALYAVTSLLSLSGTALLIKKRKDEK